MQNIPQLVPVNDKLVVRQRVRDLLEWRQAWKDEDLILEQRAAQLDPSKHLDVQRGAQIDSMRRRLRLHQVKHPLEFDPTEVKRVGWLTLRERLERGFVMLTDNERQLWLHNFLFIMLPDLRKLYDKIAAVRGYLSLGQQRNFLLAGRSGMGKTTFLDWFTSNYIPKVGIDRNFVPVLKIDAPVSNHTPKPLFQRIILECGLTYLRGDNEDDLLMKMALYFQQCRVEVLIIDEVEHITKHEIRRRVLEISNQARGIPIICASCQPHKWINGDQEVEGRWNDSFTLETYTGDRLSALLSYIELLLPFPRQSYLPDYRIPAINKKGEDSYGPAFLIEQWTKGVLKDIMILVADASSRAIEQGLPNLPIKLLEDTWKNIQTNPTIQLQEVLNS